MDNYSVWDVRPEEFPHNSHISTKLGFLCRYGLLAPSVHNAQPWEFKITGDRLTVGIAQDRMLTAGDPTTREGWVSLGACIENIMVAASHFNLNGTEVARNSDTVTYQFSTSAVNESLGQLLESIIARRSHRENYSKARVAQPILAEINAIACPGISVVASEDRQLISLIADYTGRAIGMALSNPEFRNELSSLVHNGGKVHQVGMPTFTLGVHGARAALEPRIIASGMAVNAQVRKESRAMNSSAGVVLVFAEGDSQPYWIRAGRAYQRAALIATKHGLASSTSAAAVEASDYHLDLERLVGNPGRLVGLLRIGYSKQTPRHSPRLPLTSVLTSVS